MLRRSWSIFWAFWLAVFAALPLRAETVTDLAPFTWDSDRPQVLVLDGVIGARAPTLLKRALQRFPDVETLELSSAGGAVYAALPMAYEVRDAGLKTVIPSGRSCQSACSFLFLAGVERSAEGRLGVHQISGSVGRAQAQQVLGDIFGAFEAWGVPTDVYVHMASTPSDAMHFYDPVALFDLGLIGTVVRPGAGPPPTGVIETPPLAGQAVGVAISPPLAQDAVPGRQIVVKQDGTGDFTSIAAAIEAAPEGARVEVHPGRYKGRAAVTRSIDIVGVGPRWMILWEAQDTDLVEWSAPRGSISGLSLRSIGAAPGNGAVALRIRAGTPTIVDNALTSTGGPAIHMLGADTGPTITGNLIQDSLGPGIRATDRSRGTISENQILENAPPGLVVESGADPIILDNEIRNADRVHIESVGLVMDALVRGHLVVDVQAGGLAWVSGLRRGDYVVMLEGDGNFWPGEIDRVVRERRSAGGAPVNLSVRRDTGIFDLRLRVR